MVAQGGVWQGLVRLVVRKVLVRSGLNWLCWAVFGAACGLLGHRQGAIEYGSMRLGSACGTDGLGLLGWCFVWRGLRSTQPVRGLFRCGPVRQGFW
jgi:hypothetical protein